MDNAITKAYSTSQMGGELPYFMGKQYGGGWLRSIARMAFPILKKLLGVATNIGEDVIVRDKKWGESFKSRAAEGVGQFMRGKGSSVKRSSSINRGGVGRKKQLLASTKSTIFAK